MRDRIEVFLRISVFWPKTLGSVDNASERGSDYYSLDRRRVRLDCLQAAQSALNSRVKQLLLNVLGLEMKWRSGVKYSLKWWIRDNSLVESARLCNVLDNGEAKSVTSFCVCLLDLVCFCLTTNSGDDRVTFL